MNDRRQLLGALALPAFALGVAPARLAPRGALRLAELLAGDGGRPDDEDFWSEVQRAFTVDRTLVNLNNGGVSPSPGLVQEAMRRHLEYSNQAPAHTMWHVLEPQREPLRRRMALAFGCDAEELAFTRNASESLQICQQGFDLRAGDEVLTSNQDYPRMLTTFRQRERREGIVLRTISLPVPAEDPAEVVRRFEEAIGPRTRLMLVSHVINITGQILPVRDLVAMARRHGVPVIVDGAHALAHFAFRLSDLDCDYYGTSLHKWLFAPHGTGLLYVRRDKVADLWPLMAAAEEQRDDVRKFEEIGTHPAANTLAIGEALTFHQMLRPERKEARLRFLRDRWVKRLLAHERVRLHTSLDPRFSCGIATLDVEGVEPGALTAWLWSAHRILVTPIVHAELRGVRVTPSVYTTLEELDRFCGAVEHALEHGLPG